MMRRCDGARLAYCRDRGIDDERAPVAVARRCKLRCDVLAEQHDVGGAGSFNPDSRAN
jgi:hypothetical protein